jgi:hypothetical protein
MEQFHTKFPASLYHLLVFNDSFHTHRVCKLHVVINTLETIKFLETTFFYCI